jgi:hypothetical protein
MQFDSTAVSCANPRKLVGPTPSQSCGSCGSHEAASPSVLNAPGRNESLKFGVIQALRFITQQQIAIATSN